MTRFMEASYMSIKEENYEIKYQIMYMKNLLEVIADNVVPLEKKKECPICKSKVSAFLPFGVRVRGNAMCPVCKSLERHRALWLVCQSRHMFTGGGVCFILLRKLCCISCFLLRKT